MWAGVAAFLQALPELLKLINSLGATIAQAKKDGLWRDIEESVDAAEKAKTPAERVAAARRLVGVVGRLSP